MITDRLCRPILFETPALLSELSAWNEHTPFAFWLVDAVRPKRVVELGTHSGVSYCAFCQAIAHLRVPSQCYAVDTWEGDPHARNYGEDVYRTLQGHHDGRYGAFSTLLRTTFDEAATQFGDGTIDLLHIDGYHTYDAVKHDFETWLPRMSPAGVVLLHDTAGRTKDFGVWRFWDEIATQYPSFQFVHSGGLGVVAAGSQPPEPIRWLAGLADTEIAEVRGFFERRGAVVRELLERQRLSAELGRHVVKLAARDGEVASLKAHGDSLNANIEALKTEIEKTVAASRRAQDEIQKTVGAQARELAESRLLQAEKAKELSRMVERLGAAHRRIGDLGHEVSTIDGRVSAAYTAGIASVQASTSWRVTAPLRAVSRAMRALVGR